MSIRTPSDADQMSPGDPDARPAPEVIVTHARRVKCVGVGGALGHPVVYYDIGDASFVECLYCDRRFVYEPGPGGHDDH